MTEINEHFWTTANVATYLADGLDDAERARFESHVSSCGKCLEELKDAQQAEEKLAKLFAGDRPKPGMEDRVIARLRLAPDGRRTIPGLRLLQAAAAVLLLGGLGFAVERAQNEDGGLDRDNLSFAAQKPKLHFSTLDSTRSKSSGEDESDRQDGNESKEMEKLSADEMATMSLRRMQEEIQEVAKSKEEAHHAMGAGGDARKSLEGRFGAKRDPATPPPADFPAPAPAGPGAPSESYRDDSPAKLAEPGYFRPAEAKAATRVPMSKPAPAEKGKDVNLAVVDALKKVNQERLEQANPNRKVIRTGEMEFEVEHFDSSVDKITKIVIEDGGYIGTVNSDRLPNGKVRGTITLRIPPDRLETLVLKLRALGDLKSQRITSEDVTKQYTDTESQLRAARTMEARLIEIIKSGKGEIKDILAAEQELGKWREKIEVFEGQLRFWAAQVSMSTLNLTLFEKDIRTPAGVVETETVTASLEADDVEKAYKEVLAAIAELKGRVTTSTLQKLQAGQYSGRIVAEIAPENSMALRDRLAQIAKIAGLDVQKLQNTEGGQGRPGEVKVTRNDSIFNLSLYNLVNVQPRETVKLALATPDLEELARILAQKVDKLGGRMHSSTVNRQSGDRSTAELRFDVPEKDADALNLEIKTSGEVFDYDVAVNSDTANVTRTKRGFHVILYGLGALQARESMSIQVAAADVAESFKALRKAVTELKGRVLQAQLNENDRKNVNAVLQFEVLTKEADAVEAAVRAAGWIMSRTGTRAQDQQTSIESKRAFYIQVHAAGALGPRTSHVMAIEVRDVEKAAAEAKAAAVEAKGKVTKDDISRERDGKVGGRLTFEVPYANAASLVERLKAAGVLRVLTVTKNDRAPEGDLAYGRIDLTISNEDLIIPSDSGFGQQIKEGFAGVFKAAGFSIKFFMIGLLVVGPWALILWAAAKLVKRMRKSDPPATPA